MIGIAPFPRDWDISADMVSSLSPGAVLTYRGSWYTEGENAVERVFARESERGALDGDGEAGLRGEAVARAGGVRSELAPLSPPEHGDLWRKDGHAGMSEHFFRSLDEGREPETACHQNIKSLAMVFAAIRSAAEHREVSIREILSIG